MSKICSGLYTLLAYIPIVSNKYSVHTPIKCCKMAIYSHNHTVASQDFVCTAFLQYGDTHIVPAVAIYSMVVSPTQ